MIRQHFYIEDYDWEVLVYYNTGVLNANEILSALEEIGVSLFDYTVAYDNLLSRDLNKGLCYSNYKKHKSVIVISDTSSPS